jgi:ATPase subunit of ABC transporter with duplicated ATPase domains
MRIALLGLQGAGKKTLFKLLTGSEADAVPAKACLGFFRSATRASTT